MKKITLIFLIFFLWTCGGGGGSSPTEPVEPPSIVINLTSLAGQAQKGPFSNGTSINVAELSSTLAPTGRNFSTAITDNSGRFSVANVQLESPYVELRANGFYFDEVANELSDAQLTLFSLSNLTGKTSLNVNILTHLEKNRIINLMSNSTAVTFSQAKIQAQEEVLNIFDFSRSNMPDSELLDISKNGESNAKLLAISAIIQGQLSVAQMSELLANISTDISTDGTLNDQELMDTLISNSQNLDMPEIRANLIARYASLGISATIPDFETEINQFLKPPIANDMSLSVDEDTSINVTLDASDPEGDELTFSIVETNNGSVTLNGNVANYTPNTNFNGTDTFTYFANDGTSNSNTATVTVEVGAIDDEPQTNDIDVQTDEDVALVFNLSAEEYDGDNYSFAILTQPANGTINVDGVSVTYTPNQDWNGTDTFTFEATDDRTALTNVATATITVNAINDAPVANDITNQTTDENRMMQLDITLDASDVEGDALTYSISSASNGTLSLNNDIVTYVPNQDWNGEDTFTYTANDGSLDSNTATVTITINSVNDAPVVEDGTSSGAEDTGNAGTSFSASDVDGDELTYSIVAQPANGSVSLRADGGGFEHTPDVNWNGTDTFTFKANDGELDSNIGTMTLIITPVNDAPVANDITNQTTDENRMMQLDITLDASDVEGDALTYSISSASNGTLSLNNDIVTYVPNQDWNGEDTFTYTANDGSLDSNTATVTITVNSINDIPEVFDASVSGDEDATSSVGGSSINGFKFILPEATDIESGSSDDFHNSLEIVTLPTHGRVYSNNNTGDDSPENELSVGSAINNIDDGYGARIWYVQDTEHWNGIDTFTYKANDGEADSNIATVTITVNPVNDTPETASKNLETDEDIALSIDLNNYSTDIDNDSLTFNLTYDAEHVSWETSEDNADITMTPNENWSGVIVLTFTASDGELTSNASSILITVNAVNDAPVTSDIAQVQDEDTSEIVDLSSQTTDVDNDTWSFSIINDVSNGTTNIDGSKVTYTPNTNWNGTDSYTYKANDGTDDSNTSTVTLVVNPVDDEPVTNNIIVEVDEDNSIDITLTAEEYDGDNYSFSITDQPSNGSLTLSDIVATYTPNENYNGTDSFTFEATDDTGRSMNVATATITINPVNDVPVTSDIATAMEEDTNIVINLVASDIENDDLTFNIESIPSNGSATIIDDNVSYSPNSDYSGTDTFTYSANDGELTSNISTVTITIADTNDAPTVEDIRVTLNENRLINSIFDEKENSDIKFTIKSNKSGSTDITLTGSDPDGDSLVFSIVETNTGAVSLDNNIATYTPSQDWNGVDTFSFKAFDGVLESNIAKVILTVNPQNDAPTVTDLSITTSEDTDIEFILDGTDIDGDNLTYSIITDVGIGDNNITLENNTGPNVLFEPGDDWYGTEQFTYMTNDGSLDSNTAQVTLVVSPVNDAPTANDVTATVSETRTARSYFSLDANDVDGDNLQYLILDNVSNGTLSLNGSEVNYIPNQDFVGQDTLTYKVNDSLLDSNIATAVITISAVNDAPVTEDVYTSTDEDNSVSLTLFGSDIDSSSLTYVVSSLPENGTINQANNSIEYQPNSNWNGQDYLKFYAVDEDSKRSNVSYAYIQVNPMEDAPYFAGDSLDWYYTLEYGIQDTFSFPLESFDPDGDNITWSTVESTTPFIFNSDQSEIYILEENVSPGGSYAVKVYGEDDKGNQGSSGIITLDIIGGPTGIKDIMEVDHNWEDSTPGNTATGDFNGDGGSWLRDAAVSYVPWASLGRTGYIIEHRAGGAVNQTTYARDFDRFNYWSIPSQFDIELDFSQQSLAWDYINFTVNGYVPFSAYLIDNFSNEKTQLFAGYWENDGVAGWSNDGSTWAGPIYSASSMEPIYLFWHLGTPYNSANESQYISDNDLTTSGGCAWSCSGAAPIQSSNSNLPSVTPTYPIMTATLFTDYLSTGLLPTAAGHIAHNSGWDTASSIIFDTEYEYYDTPQGNNDDSSRRDDFIEYDDNALPQFENNRQRNLNENINVSPLNYEPEK